MRWTLLFLAVVVGIAAGAIWAVSVAVQDRALVQRSRQPNSTDVARAKTLLGRHDPRRIPPGARRVVVMSERDLNLAANYALGLVGDGAVEIVLRPGLADIQASIRLPESPLGRYLNLRAALGTDEGGAGSFPGLSRLQVGGLRIPRLLANWGFVQGLEYLYRTPREAGEGAPIEPTDVVESVRIERSRMEIAYRWPENALERIQSQLVGPAQRERLERYHRALVEVAAGVKGSRLGMLALIKPLFELAERRGRGGDPVAENRSALVVLTAYINGHGLGSILPGARQWPSARRLSVTLQRRRDFSQHFLTSAALSAVGGGALSNAIGLFKEVDDSRGGSGFSFTDLVADRAGTRFGEVAVRSERSALALVSAVAAMRSESELIPPTRDLPENMTDAEFRRRFGGLEGAAYGRMSEKIDRRIAKISLYR